MIIEKRFKHFTVTVEHDEHPTNPREFNESMSSMICFHNRNYILLGDNHTMSPDALREHIKREDVVSLPLYLYDHSGITINTTGFACKWDSGQVGRICATYDRIREWYGVEEVTPEVIERAHQTMRSEVAEYDRYLTGEVYAVIVRKKEYNAERNEVIETCIHSCGGFYEVADAIEDAIQYVDEETATALKAEFLTPVTA
ncbi:hypothetical protein UFOVP451_40 [uncultured Caudovirales phage]|uniref:Uncharacterized protein n=1 Tax=uncultured Caudovirales phage TaxID=2100421 RepID=A0A6J5MC21_9CAUD|nr:hypothetical protein UFOVP451_40 [uncultured Caudovirales phage]